MPRSHTFRFKQFSINQDRCAMKVCTDAVFFGATIAVSNAKMVLDIGTGTGLLALMIAQRSKAAIIGIDIDHDAVLQAQENVEASVFKDRIHIIEAAVQTFEHEGFDHIVSNPPFFQNSLLSDKNKVNLAHHAQTLKLNELLEAVARLLKKEGLFSVLLPPYEFEQLLQQSESHGLTLVETTTLRSSDLKPVLRVTGTFQKGQSTALKRKTMSIYKNDLKSYTPEFQLLINDFYL